jgi:hypothetical protein
LVCDWRFEEFSTAERFGAGTTKSSVILAWRLRKKAADALYVIAVLITEALDQQRTRHQSAVSAGNFNIFNRQNLATQSLVNAVHGGSAAGKIFYIAEPMRNMQSALRLTC